MLRNKSLTKLKTFECQMCNANQVAADFQIVVNMPRAIIEKLNMPCYLGDVVCRKGGA